MSEAKAADGEAPKKKSKLLLFIIIGVVVLAVGAGAAFMLMKKKPADEEGEDGEEVAAESHKPKKEGKIEPPVFVKLEPFTVRLQTEGQDSYLQAVPELRVLDLHIGDQVKQFMPEIRHKALLVIAAKRPEEVNNPEGVQKLSDELRVTINKILTPPPTGKKKKKKEVEEEISAEPEPDDPVQAVLFTSFIVQ